MGNNESEVVSLPRPAGHGGTDKIEAEEEEPEIKPGGAVNVGPGDAGAEARLKQSGGNADAGQGNE